MVEKQIIHGLNCPECGGTLEIEEGRTVVNCPFCGISSLLTGEKGVLHLQVKPDVGQEQVKAVVRRFFRRWDRDPELEQEATIQECFVAYLPYWRVSMRAAAWLSGRSIGEDTDTPVEKAITEDFVWTGAAYDPSEFGLRELKKLQGRELEPFDRGALQQHALVFEPEGSDAKAIKQAEAAFKAAAHRQSGVTKTLFQRFQFFGRRLSLIHYPLWIVRYVYRGRSYRVVVDGHKVVYGQAPGNPAWRAAILVLAVLVGATLPLDFVMWWARMVLLEPFVWTSGLKLLANSLPCMIYWATTLAVTWLSVAIMLAGYRFFRFGGERLVGRKGKFLDRTIWPTGTWSVGLVLFMILAVIVPGRLDILMPTYVLISFTSLGLGLLIRRRSPPSKVRSWDDLFGQADWLWKARPASATPTGMPALLPVHCPNCRTPLPAREGEVAYLCQGCGWGLELPSGGPILSAAEGPRPIEIAFAAPQPHPRIKGARHLPFWVFDGQVRIQTRDAVRHRLLGQEKPSPERGGFWQEPRRLYVPAFETRLENLRAWGVDLTRNQPGYPPGEIGPLKGCIYTEAEARELAELIFLGVEFGRSDIMQEIDYSLTLTSPRLLVIPFVGVSK
jgi:predicted RNA-binding Zn-ribbon protein involved in translation (DUF1610 family)